ncbi:taste receptor type 2 member 8-like [Hyla sarda]|uniref:taste receptor type 2 member 8-like n=1 Tax=Hyla sarda TaxID=327740 RepID=UPI0024C33B64|nr:taste receptor type 2 member 8-like [Hyla sarda]
MDSPYEKAFFAILLLEATIGSLSSFLLIVSLILKEFRKKNIGTYSRILIPLNMSNICYSIILSLNFDTNFLSPKLYGNVSVHHTITYMTMYSITSYMWLSAVLCVFYFMKIVSSQPGVLTTLKSRMGAVVMWLIITSEVVSLGGSFLSMVPLRPQTDQRNSSISLSEVTSGTSTQKAFVTNVLILNSLPFLVIIMTTIGSAGFLKLYNHQIQKSMKTSGSTRVKDYRAAIYTMIGLLALYVTILLCSILIVLGVFSHLPLGYCLCVIFLFLCATSLPALLIYGNPVLKEAIKQIFTC